MRCMTADENLMEYCALYLAVGNSETNQCFVLLDLYMSFWKDGDGGADIEIFFGFDSD